ncbi:MAG: Type II secretory pathway, pullulanase PulA [Alphaproteobacteria bacterium HGW-Alphaproteobacteria-4]|nr:MAG: Type II secretory pathway, pullulanase PulA [Alphaproteobacteria bacterium HGW-Alphaproteobacteria-4]
MIISRGRRYIFVHIPKTGGTALTAALESRALADDILISDTPKARRRRRRLQGVQAAGRIWKHATLADAIGLITAAEAQAFFTFTLVRNPWDRMVSYYHWLRSQTFAHPQVALARATDFSGFLNTPATQTAVGATPYASYLTLPGVGECCDAFLRLEHLAEDAAPLEAHLGFALPPTPRVNTSARAADWRGYYSQSDAALVGRLCAADVARFGYEF